MSFQIRSVFQNILYFNERMLPPDIFIQVGLPSDTTPPTKGGMKGNRIFLLIPTKQLRYSPFCSTERDKMKRNDIKESISMDQWSVL